MVSQSVSLSNIYMYMSMKALETSLLVHLTWEEENPPAFSYPSKEKCVGKSPDFPAHTALYPRSPCWGKLSAREH